MTASLPREMEIMNLIQIMKDPGSVYSYEKPSEALLAKNALLMQYLRDNVEEYSSVRR